MTRTEHVNYFCRLHILKKLLSVDKIKSHSDMYDEIILIYWVLLNSKVSFNIDDLNYDFFNYSGYPEIKNLLNCFPKEYFLGLIKNIQKIYYSNHTVNSYLNNNPTTFSNQDLTLSIKKGDLTCFFIIYKSLIRYTSYSVGLQHYSIDDMILFTQSEFDTFIKNMSEYHSLDKDVLNMIFIY